MFKESNIFSLACLYLWKQLSEADIEARLTYGGLSKIDPLAFLNVLRINVIGLGIEGWRNWTLMDVIPQITKN